MKKLLVILSLFVTAFSSLSIMPPWWYQQTLPVNDFVNDIYFVDTLNGWIVTQGHTNNNDTAYIMKTTNGGDNWNIQYARNVNLTTLQFVDSQTGYVGGGSGSGTKNLYKTTNGGSNWNQVIGTLGGLITDEHFYNSDTGWYSADSPFDGGLFKTTNGGGSWVKQLDQTYSIKRVHFINEDTGWVASNDRKLYRTTNGGTNWVLQFTSPGQINDIYFFNSQRGLISGPITRYSTNGGASWNTSNDGGIKLSFADDSVGWAGNNLNTIIKTTNGGRTWYRQTTNISNPSVAAIDSLHCWAGGSGVVKTTDGGPAMNVELINSEVPDAFRLYQNYPNPFNPSTIINYQIVMSNYVRLTVYDITGKAVQTLVDQKQIAGSYQYTFDGTGLSSGLYFYTLRTEGYTETKKMLLVK